MKKYFLFSVAVTCSLFVQAQDYESIKNLLVLIKFKPAKEKLDLAMQNAQFTARPEAYILKATLYSWMASQAETKGTAAGDALLSEADIAFTKFRTMDPSLVLLSDPVYQKGPINIYSELYTSGYTDYQNKNWAQGLQKFKKVVEYSDLLISKKFFAMPIDTNALILAGIISENAASPIDAAKYYGRLADAKITGEGFESVYRFLVSYYFTKKDLTSFEKYKALGKAVYPQSSYFTFDRIDFAIGLETDWAKKVAAVDELLATDPNNEKANQVLGEIIYDTLVPRTPNAVPPANAVQLEKKMIAAFNKSAAANSNNALSFIYIGNYYVQRSITIKEAMANAPDKNALTQQYNTAFENARVPYEKAVAIFATKSTLSDTDKKQYKNIVAYLSEIYLNKKDEAGAKKWSDFYETIK